MLFKVKMFSILSFWKHPDTASIFIHLSTTVAIGYTGHIIWEKKQTNWHLRFFSKSTTHLLSYNMPVPHILMVSMFLLFNHRLLISLADGTASCMHSGSGPVLWWWFPSIICSESNLGGFGVTGSSWEAHELLSSVAALEKINVTKYIKYDF